MYCIVYKWHYNDGGGWMRNIPDSKPPHEVIEEMQKQVAAFGHKTGVTWQLCENNLVKAMVASAKL